MELFVSGGDQCACTGNTRLGSKPDTLLIPAGREAVVVKGGKGEPHLERKKKSNGSGKGEASPELYDGRVKQGKERA